MALVAKKKCSYCEATQPRENFPPGKKRLCYSCAVLKAKQEAKKQAYVAQPLGGKPRRWESGW